MTKAEVKKAKRKLAAPEPESPTQRTADDYRTALEAVVSITMDGLRGEGWKPKKEN